MSKRNEANLKYKNVNMALVNSLTINSYNFQCAAKNELKSIIDRKEESIIKDDSISYITDIHLLHRFEANNCQIFPSDYVKQIDVITDTIARDSVNINLIGGDLSSDFNYYKLFFDRLTSKTSNLFFVTLGNHELWPFNKKKLPEIVKTYNEYLSSKGVFLVHNNLYYICCDGVHQISFDYLSTISDEELKELTKDAGLIIFGGIGFSGKNEKFNAKQGIYLDVLNRKEEINQSNIFNDLFEQVCRVLCDKKVIVLTHMPQEDWDKDYNYVEKNAGFIFVSGHNHNNCFEDDSVRRIYSDNQIGYNRKTVALKYLSVSRNYNSLSNYEDGIYEITKNEYYKFNRDLNIDIELNREFQTIYMLKREGYYMFLIKTLAGSLCVLNGGQMKTAGKHPIRYFYDNMLRYADSIKDFLENYNNFLKQVSSEVIKIGGWGSVHGCIVDIDAFNHLYINPFDGSITAYYAISETNKDVYKNFISLLSIKFPNMYNNYKRLISDSKENALILYNPNDLVSEETIHNTDTIIYSFSYRISNLDYIQKNIIRRWIDDYLDKTPYEIASLLLEEVKKQNSKPKTDKQTYEYRKFYNRILKKKR
ncbi:MAG: metallophosphoesterase [Bacilli bacterium]|nr:metallophosphoesterase [Bacilli bacterium]